MPSLLPLPSNSIACIFHPCNCQIPLLSNSTLFGKHEGGLRLLICDTLEKHLLTYLLTYLLGHNEGEDDNDDDRVDSGNERM